MTASVPSRLRLTRPRRPGLVATVATVGLLAVAGCAGPAPQSTDGTETLSLVATLGGLDTAGYERALEVRDFVFPEDHGPHPGFRTEWWYVTGNLTSREGRTFGFQFTIFRSALAPADPGGPSAWSTNQAYMGHFALTDITGEDFRSEERFARGGAGLAGAQAEPLRVWIEDWELSAADPAATGTVRASPFPMTLRADGKGVDLELVLQSGKPRVLQGDRGLSQKGAEPGNASYYYAHTRMPAEGRVTLDGQTYRVSGLAWLDREWSTSALSEGQVGWDWFALQLDDGWEMMVYQLRLEDGSADPLSDGVLIDPAGRRISLSWGDQVTVTPTGRWRSPVDGAEYPSGWRVTVPDRGWDLSVEPAVLDQELRVAFRYWEGAVRVEGVGERGRPIRGRGYVELTGYAGAGIE
ncbi:MAG: carotenoid 1,2-hydratase [Gemmatimonadota bacterium]|nr:carotenoid 1,2-hydratase [Gemmatimonadota bacterium]